MASSVALVCVIVIFIQLTLVFASPAISSTEENLMGGGHRKSLLHRRISDAAVGKNEKESMTTTSDRRKLEEAGGGLLSAIATSGHRRSSGGGGGYFGYGSSTTGGAGGDTVTVSNYADSGLNTLRYWCGLAGARVIKFERDGTITLRSRVECTNDKTVDGSGVQITIRGWGLSANRVSNVVFKSLCIKDTRVDGVTIRMSNNIVVQGCSISNVGDGAIDTIGGSKGVSILNNHFSRLWKTLLIGNSDSVSSDRSITVTVAFNHFDGCISRQPRARFGRVHVCSNVYDQWGNYAVGASEGAQLLVEGNYFHPGRDRYINNLHAGERDGTKIEYKSNQYNGALLLIQSVGRVSMPYTCPTRSEASIRSGAGVGFDC